MAVAVSLTYAAKASVIRIMLFPLLAPAECPISAIRSMSTSPRQRMYLCRRSVSY